ncbi:MAG: MOSC domain-containing protein [Gammaproteobacteria bacterium]|nr:MOSC domain-containing protein [Gammaproteobacteria bacterium]MCW8923108.1 MOSC domain-containing protein [Gammaproteobacteria bacterium]
MSKLIISELAIYPVKSMRQVSLKKSAMDMGGLKYDRRWMVVDADGVMITQRKVVRLCLIQPELTARGLMLTTEAMPEIKVSIPDGRVSRKVKVWNDECNACDGGDEVASWLSEFLKIECRLVYFPDGETRIVDQDYAQPNDQTAFSDGFPILLTSQASLDDLNSRMDEDVPMARFRPNIVVSGCEAFAEDNWKQLQVGDISLRIVKPCSRCIVPNVDIDSAERRKEPVKTLASYRKRDNKIFFGQNVVADGEGELEVGMEVKISD